ncbi:MAG: CoA synthetase, partial [Rhodospirillaceae bacterium]|nr:CoA synthetase [Rhodospirillaceae bacterium]
YAPDAAHLAHYAKQARSTDGFQSYLAEHGA